LRGCVDTIITIPNTNLFELQENISITDAFRQADEVLLHAVQGITELITTPGTINVDFADVRTVMKDGGVALMGVGMAKAPGAPIQAMRAALDYKLLEENSIAGAKAALINVTCGPNVPLVEIRDAMSMVESEADRDADIIWGTVIRDDMQDEVRITLIATGFDVAAAASRPDFTHKREAQIAVGAGAIAPASDHLPSEDLEIPAFIRRQAD
jgi:cell division protein FtsZ